jgi:hypothetical protein
MALKAVTDHFWIFEGWFGRLVDVERSRFPGYVEAIAEARRLANGE